MVTGEIDFDLGVVAFGQVEVAGHALDARRIAQFEPGRAGDRAEGVACFTAVLSFVDFPQF